MAAADSTSLVAADSTGLVAAIDFETIDYVPFVMASIQMWADDLMGASWVSIHEHERLLFVAAAH